MKRTPLKFVSKKRSAELREYAMLKIEYFNENRRCEICGNLGDKHSLQIHHKKHRGKYLNDVSTWMCLCPYCHAYVHAHPAESYEKGWLIKL